MRGRHLADFRSLPWATDTTRSDVCRRLCGGISRLEDLPPRALDRPGVVPLRRDAADADRDRLLGGETARRLPARAGPAAARGGPRAAPPAAALIYRYRDGQEERLDLGAELFHLLLELNDGYQLGDVSSDDAFANLSIFVQRLVQEDARELFAWNPMADEAVYRIAAERHAAGDGLQQILTLAPLLAQDEGLTMPSTPTAARAIVDEVFGRGMTREIWTGNYEEVLPVSVQDFDLGAILPAVFYMFRFGGRRGKGRFVEQFGEGTGAQGQAPRPSNGYHRRSLMGNTSRALETRLRGPSWATCSFATAWRIAAAPWEGTSRSNASHRLITWQAGWICQEKRSDLRYVPEMVVALLADQEGEFVDQTPEGERSWFAVGRGFDRNVLLAAFNQGIGHNGLLGDRSSDRFREDSEVGLDQLLMIRLAQKLGQAPDKLQGKEHRISNQRPIAQSAARDFSEDLPLRAHLRRSHTSARLCRTARILHGGWAQHNRDQHDRPGPQLGHHRSDPRAG